MANGDVLYMTAPKAVEKVNIADRAFFAEARDAPAGTLVYSDVLTNRITQRPSLFISLPIRDEQGEFRGVVSAAIDLDYFNAIFERQNIGPNGVVSILRTDTFKIVSRWPVVDFARPNMTLTQPSVMMLKGVKKGSGNLAGPLDGVMRFYGFGALDRYPFFVSVGLARSDILAAWWERTIALGTFGAILIGALTSVLMRLWRSEEHERQILLALSDSEARARLILDTSMDAVVGIDASGTITEWNAGATSMFGYPPNVAIGGSFSELIVPPSLRDSQRRAMERFLRDGTSNVIGRRAETKSMRADGSEFPVELTTAHVMRGDEHFFSIFVRDISMQKKAEAERVLLEQRLYQSQKLEAIGKLTGGMAHDFNNYLGVIIGNLDLLAERIKTDPVAERLLASAMSGTTRSAELTQSLLAFSRNQPLAPRRVRLNTHLPDLIDLLRRTMGDKAVLKADLAPDLWPTRTDAAQLDSCIVNLVNNARDAMPGGGILTIAARNVGESSIGEGFLAAPELAAGDYIVIEISDTGAGMTPEVAALAFEPFFTTKPVGHGTGLGLSMAHGFVKQSGGHIEIESVIGRGTTVRFYLPRDRGAEDDGGDPALSAMLVQPPGKETVLVVDDNEDMREVVIAQITALGYRAVEAADGAAALRILEQGDPHIDLLLSDVIMPGGLDGYQLGAKARELRPDLKVLLSSGFTERSSGGTGGHDDEFALLRKPYRRETLAQAIRDVLDQKADTRS